MWPKPSSQTLTVLLVVALVCILLVSGPAHAVLHSDSPSDGCNACHVTLLELADPVLLPALVEEVVAFEAPAVDVPREAQVAPASAPRAPPLR